VTVHIYDPVANCDITLYPQNHSAILVKYKVYPAPHPKYPAMIDPDVKAGDLGKGLGQPPLLTPDIRSEELGVEVIEGMPLRHGRQTAHYPAGYAGQKNSDDAVTDYWYSQELQSFVLVKQVGPHKSVNTLRVRDIRREDPEPSLFKIPKGYEVTKQISKEYKPI
jgi:hypothetical protein